MDINKNLVKKYLNYKGLVSGFESLIDDVFLEVKKISNPKKLCILSKAFKEDGFYRLDKLNLTLKSQDINILKEDHKEKVMEKI